MATNFIKLDYSISEKKIEVLNDDLDTKPLFYIEVIPNADFDFDYILFKNYYTYFINIIQFANEKWKCVLNDYKLMPNTDCDEDSEKYFVIYAKQLVENGFSNDAKFLRIYLSQDCNIWKSFYISQVMFIKTKESNDNYNKYISNNSRFEFELDKNNFFNKNNLNTQQITILNDKEEINQKYIEIMKVNNINDLNFTIFK